jgi:hypothetical protein
MNSVFSMHERMLLVKKSHLKICLKMSQRSDPKGTLHNVTSEEPQERILHNVTSQERILHNVTSEEPQERILHNVTRGKQSVEVIMSQGVELSARGSNGISGIGHGRSKSGKRSGKNSLVQED